jgi:methylated-DNA-[protein]-cysteine S-methyltransferase
MNYSYDTFKTPLGKFSVAVDANGHVAASAFGGLAALRGRLGPGGLTRDSNALAEVRRETAEYFQGKRKTFTLPLTPRGTAFQKSVWRGLQHIPFGETRSYGELATDLRLGSAARAVGRANATNPISLYIPCHRVIGGDGSLTGYAFGEEIKLRLLEHEGALQPA